MCLSVSNFQCLYVFLSVPVVIVCFSVFFFLSMLSLCIYVFMSSCLYFFQSLWFLSLSVCFYVYLPVCLSTYMSFYLCVTGEFLFYLCISYHSVHLVAFQFVPLSPFLAFSLSIYAIVVFLCFYLSQSC